MSIVDESDKEIFTAIYKDNDEFDQYSNTINRHVRIHRSEKFVCHILANGDLIERKEIER